MKFYGDDVAMTIIAHELAHYHLEHYKKRENNPRNEIEADELARSWGFDIEKFRKAFPLNGKET